MFGNIYSAFQSDSFDVDTASFKAKMAEDKEGVILDVRTKEEFDAGHIPNSVNLDIMSFDFLDQVQSLDKNKAYFVYCRSGNRSHSACREMKKLGIEKVFNLEDGLLGWDEPLTK